MSLILFLRKLIKIIRAGSSSRQIGLGLSLGALAGLPPFGLIPFAFIVLFFVLNANLGGFILALGLSKLLSVAIAPLLGSFGEMLLSMEGLKGFWTSVLNLPVVSLCGLDGYLAMGSTVGSFILAVLLYGIAMVAVRPLREAWNRAAEKATFLTKLGKIPVLGGLLRLIFGKKSDEEAKAGGLIRKGFVVPAALFVLLAATAWWIGGDALTKGGIQILASQTTGKDVRLSNASLGLLLGSLNIQEMVVAQPKIESEEGGGGGASDQLVEGEKLSFGLNSMKLLSRRFVVDEALVENMNYYVGSQAKDLPKAPPAPEPDEPVDFQQILDWVESHEEQLKWAFDQLDGVLKKGSEPPEEKAPGYEGRAAYIYANPTNPTFLVRSAGVRNLKLDWGEAKGPLTGLTQLDLTLANLSSNPALQDEALSLNAGGEYLGQKIEMTGVFDARKTSSEGHKISLSMNSGSFGSASSLGLKDAKDLSLQLTAGFDPATGSLREPKCTGSFSAKGISEVRFTFLGGDDTAIDLAVMGLNLSDVTGVARPDGVRMDQGKVDLNLRLGVNPSNSLTGDLTLLARDLKISPGSESTLAGLNASDVCRGINSLTTKEPLRLSFKVSGDSGSPRVSLADSGMAELLAQVKTGLLMAGEKALASEVEKRLAPYQAKLGEEFQKHQKDLEKRLGKDLSGVLGDKVGLPEGKLDPNLEKVSESVTEKASSLLGGLLGNKKKKTEEDDEKKKKKN